MVAAREVLQWSPERVRQLGCAALSMNIAMTGLQDQLAQQLDSLSGPQISAIESHAGDSQALLRSLGVEDPVWLEAVRLHHQRTPGPLAHKNEAEQLARLMQRADVFGARIAPRASRTPMPVTAAMQASYYDEERQVDEAGAALVKALGVYPPGCLVRLASQEVAVVLRRGPTATTPRVAVVISRTGLPTGCLQQDLAERRITHDSYFHSVLGLMDVRTGAYNAELDTFTPCRSKTASLARAPAPDGTATRPAPRARG